MKKTIILTSCALVGLFILGQTSDIFTSKPAHATAQTSKLSPHDKDNNSLPFEAFFKHEVFTLENGLRVIVHEDRSTPAVSITTFFHVGSKNEPIGKTGFAHLFEHLLFNGTKNAPGEFFTHLDEIGATGTNGTTNFDRTNYFETVPTGALERALWLESDRFVTFLDGMTQETLDTQIEVVKNEKGLRDNAPFGQAYYDELAQIYPANHPYSRSIIGSIEDLENATLDDARKWFKDYYGARNTVLVLSGDVSRAEAEPLVKKYFDRMAPGPGISRPKKMPVRRLSNTMQTVTDVAPDSMLKRSYLLPANTDRKGYLTSVALRIFASGEQSKLYRRFVNDKKLAKSLYTISLGAELTGGYAINITPAEGVSLERLSEELDAAFDEYLKKGPDANDLKRFKGQTRATYISASENLQMKGSFLGSGMMYHGDPLYHLKTVSWLKSVKPKELREYANDWLSVGYHETHYIAEIVAEITPHDLDFSRKPAVKPTVEKPLPEPDRFKLSNGLEVVLVPRENSPRVLISYDSPIGRAHYDLETAAYARLVSAFIREGGAGGVDRESLEEHKATIGAEILGFVSRDYSSIALVTDIESLNDGLDVWSDVLLRPNFSDEDFKYFQEQNLQFLESDKKDKGRIANQIAGIKIYGESYETIDEKIEFWQNADLKIAKDIAKTIFRPDGAKLYVVGGVEKDILLPMLESRLGNWTGKVEKRPIIRRSIEPAPARPRFILMNDEGSSQTRITALRTFPLHDGDAYLEHMVNDVWGGGFTARLNLNLREDKGWTYGVRSSLAQVPELDSRWSIGGSFTAEHTVETIEEIVKEINDINENRPVTREELNKTVQPRIDGFANNLGNIFAIARLYPDNDRLGKPHSYINGYKDRLAAITPQQIMKHVPDIIKAEDLTWVLVGDLDIFEDQLRAANIGDVEVYNISGMRIR